MAAYHRTAACQGGASALADHWSPDRRATLVVPPDADPACLRCRTAACQGGASVRLFVAAGALTWYMRTHATHAGSESCGTWGYTPPWQAAVRQGRRAGSASGGTADMAYVAAGIAVRCGLPRVAYSRLAAYSASHGAMAK